MHADGHPCEPVCSADRCYYKQLSIQSPARPSRATCRRNQSRAHFSFTRWDAETFDSCTFPRICECCSLRRTAAWQPATAATAAAAAATAHAAGSSVDAAAACRAEPLQQWELEMPEGKEVECLIDRLKVRLHAAFSHTGAPF